MPFRVQDLMHHASDMLKISVVTGVGGLRKIIRWPEALRPGLALAGYHKRQGRGRILVFGRLEGAYLQDLTPEQRMERLSALLAHSVPAVITTQRCAPIPELLQICEERQIPVMKSTLRTMEFFSKLTILLHQRFAPTTMLHATMVEVFGIGMLIRGDSSVGKSEAALGLIERGHRLISDDLVSITKQDSDRLEATGPDITRHHIEIRGIGILNVAYLYGAVCVCESKRIDLAVHLEQWDEARCYDRLGEEQSTCEILGVAVPSHVLPVKPGRDVVLLLETLALNHRLREMGYNAAKELNQKLMDHIALRQKGRKKRSSNTP